MEIKVAEINAPLNIMTRKLTLTKIRRIFRNRVNSMKRDKVRR